MMIEWDDAPASSMTEELLWYKDALIYQLHVRSFADSDNDGVGDFQGLTKKLNYLQDLGVTTIWLLPFYPSPLRDDGYDIGDYTGVHSMYGTLHDFRVFLDEAHKRDLRIITELVINHTSDQHPWFQRARRAPPGSTYRDYYVWSDSADKYAGTRIIFKDFEFSNWSWDPVAQAYYWHRFYSHQPDLNFDNPDVQNEVLKVMEFWLGLGVDGLRLDAVPYLYEREGTNCENLPETHAFLKKLRRHVDLHFQDRMLLAEANQWPEDAVTYFGDGDECHMAFHFPLMPRMFGALRLEDRFPITETLYQTPAIPGVCQWALFLRNHDELTLEMVTAEERSFMYRTYAPDPRARINLGIRRRLAPLLQNDRKQIELLHSLLFALPGTPVIYYGDEIGMGDNIYLGDRDGVRTPMQWSHDLNAGFSRANPQRVFLPVIIDPAYHYEAVNVEAQQATSYSLLHWMKHLIATRKRYKAFSRGTLTFLYPENRKTLVFTRQYEDECILVVANLSRSIECVELDLSTYEGMTPVEVFGQNPFPPIGELPYFLTLGPHAFYWFVLAQQLGTTSLRGTSHDEHMPTLTVAADSTGSLLHAIFNSPRTRAALERILPAYLKRRRWFGGKARTIQATNIREYVPIPYTTPVGYITMIQIDYREGDHETYVVPFTVATGDLAAHVLNTFPQIVVAHINFEGTTQQGILYDAMRDTDFAMTLLESIAQHRSFGGTNGEIMAHPIGSFRLLSEITLGKTSRSATQEEVSQPGEADNPTSAAHTDLAPTVTTTDQSHTTVMYGHQFLLKLFRRIELGVNPDLEIGRFLTEKVSLARVPLVTGALEYQQKSYGPITLGVLRAFDPQQEDAWNFTQNALRHYFERVVALYTHQQGPSTNSHRVEEQVLPLPYKHLLDLANEPVSDLGQQLIGDYLDTVRLLGQRTAELHIALAQETDDPLFMPEPFTDFFQRPFYHAMLGLMDRDFQLLQQHVAKLPETAREDARTVTALEEDVRRYFLPFRDRKITAMRIRCHGNYHLGKVLCVDGDFTITDFEGEPTRSLEERRTKVSPLRDVASMIRSFHYAAYVALFEGEADGSYLPARPIAETWARFWYVWVSSVFLRAYLDTSSQSALLSQTREESRVLLDAYLLEKALYELGYELNNRPDWVKIPLQGILQLLER